MSYIIVTVGYLDNHQILQFLSSLPSIHLVIPLYSINKALFLEPFHLLEDGIFLMTNRYVSLNIHSGTR